MIQPILFRHYRGAPVALLPCEAHSDTLLAPLYVLRGRWIDAPTGVDPTEVMMHSRPLDAHSPEARRLREQLRFARKLRVVKRLPADHEARRAEYARMSAAAMGRLNAELQDSLNRLARVASRVLRMSKRR